MASVRMHVRPGEYSINDNMRAQTPTRAPVSVTGEPFLPRGSQEAKTHSAVFFFFGPSDDGFHGWGRGRGGGCVGGQLGNVEFEMFLICATIFI